MSSIDDILKANQQFASTFRTGSQPIAPAKKLAVLACMDARLNVERALGLDAGDAHIIRNAGGIADESALRSLIISHRVLGTNQFIVINHTDCGMMKFDGDQLRSDLRATTGSDAAVPRSFHTFSDLEQNVREQMEAIRSHPWLSRDIAVRGFIYDVNTGRLREVQSAGGAGKP